MKKDDDVQITFNSALLKQLADPRPMAEFVATALFHLVDRRIGTRTKRTQHVEVIALSDTIATAAAIAGDRETEIVFLGVALASGRQHGLRSASLLSAHAWRLVRLAAACVELGRRPPMRDLDRLLTRFKLGPSEVVAIARALADASALREVHLKRVEAVCGTELAQLLRKGDTDGAALRHAQLVRELKAASRSPGAPGADGTGPR